MRGRPPDFRNNFINNQTHVRQQMADIQWDDGVTGNYWSGQTGIDVDSDGIGDTCYQINESACDLLPSIYPFPIVDVDIKVNEADEPLWITWKDNARISIGMDLFCLF